MLRLTTWNVQSKPGRAWPLLTQIAPDICVIQETPLSWRPEGWADDSRLRLKDTGVPSKAFGVFALNDEWAIEDYKDGVEPLPWTVPVIVTRAGMEFLLIGMWALGRDKCGTSYETQLAGVLDRYGPLTHDRDVVIAGDMNSWAHGAGAKRYLRNIDTARSYGLVSAYHTTRGQEADAHVPTTLRWGGGDQAFHCDLIFIPQAWSETATVELGDEAVVLDTKVSDHLPVTLTSGIHL